MKGSKRIAAYEAAVEAAARELAAYQQQFPAKNRRVNTTELRVVPRTEDEQEGEAA